MRLPSAPRRGLCRIAEPRGAVPMRNPRGRRGARRQIERSGDRKLTTGAALPEIVPVKRHGTDADGFPLVRPLAGAETAGYRLRGTAGDELAEGERALARLVRRDAGEIEAEIIRRLETAVNRVVGVFRQTHDGGVIVAADRRDRSEYRVLGHDAAGLAADELVVAEELPSRRFGKRASILERLGPATAPGAISRLIIAAHDIPAAFPPEALAEADAARPLAAAGEFDGRADLRALSLVTIDGSDARDFDDAVW